VFHEIAIGGAGLPVAVAVKEVGSASQAIVLATEVHSRALLMDDRDGIQVAAASGVNVIRTPRHLPSGEGEATHTSGPPEARSTPTGGVPASRRALPGHPGKHRRIARLPASIATTDVHFAREGNHSY
jgi:hypothetical protein